MQGRGGQFANKNGPKGFKRSDDRVREDVCERLTRADVDASEIEVEVKDGEVTLRGTVSERWMKHEAERTIEGVSGVKDVQNQIRVQQSEGATGRGGVEESKDMPMRGKNSVHRA
jgi:osmotically-inducible protein OsmY